MLETLLEELLAFHKSWEPESLMDTEQIHARIDALGALARKAQDLQKALNNHTVRFEQKSEYWFFWAAGGHVVAEGHSPQEAFMRLGYSGSVVRLVDFYDTIAVDSASVLYKRAWPDDENSAKMYAERNIKAIQEYLDSLEDVSEYKDAIVRLVNSQEGEKHPMALHIVKHFAGKMNERKA